MNSQSTPQNTYDSFISSAICDNEDRNFHENKLHYIFVADKKSINHVSTANLKKDDTYDIFTVETTIPPAKISNEISIIDKINKIINKLCNERNIILYVLLADSANKDNKFISLFNNFLIDIPNKYYSNIIIFNFFNSNNIYLKYREFREKELKNIISITDDLTNKYLKYKACKVFCLSNIINIEDNSKKFFRILNVCCDTLFSKEPINYIYSDKKKYTYNFIHSSSLYNYKELNDLIIERRCSSGKLIQFTGTCWMNAILNALLLPKLSRRYMIEQCKINVNTNPTLNKTPLYDIYKERNNLSYENILNSIIYNIFIKKERPSILKKDLDNDFILAFAYKIKRYLASIYPDRFKKEKKLIEKGDIKFGTGGDPYCITSSVKVILSEYLKDFQDKYRVFLFELPPRFNRLEINEMKKPHFNKIIIKKSLRYKLTACLLSQRNGKHMICGFICDDKEYLYNSNMRTAIECNWTNYDYQRYIDYYNEKTNHNEDSIYMEVLIYTLETDEDVKHLKTIN